MKNHSVVGKRLPRVDGIIKANGKAQYAGDMVLPRMLYGKILRSPYPHARILNVDTSKAEKIPGVKAVITGKDTLGVKYCIIDFSTFPDEHLLAIDKVRYIGDEIAAVAAADEDMAEEALDLIKVEHEELPAVFDPEEAMKPGAPKIHDDVENNISLKSLTEFGDVEKAFKESHYIREDSFKLQAVTHGFLEPHAALSSFDPFSGNLTIWSSIQSPWALSHGLARTLGISEGKLRVIKPYVGGGLGGKIDVFGAQFCSAFLSIKTGNPVKIVYSLEEVFTATRLRHAMIIKLKIGVKEDGTLMACQGKVIADGGAYNSNGPAIVYVAGAAMHLPCRIPNSKYEGYHVYTNKPAGGAQRGFGYPQMRFAAESQLDMIAEDLGIDPMELRLRNALKPGDNTPSGLKITSCAFDECMQKVAEGACWKEKKGKLSENHGIGIGGSGQVSGALVPPILASSAFIKVNKDSTISLLTGASDIGQGSDTVLSQIVAEELGVALEDVKITTADTEITPMDPGSFSSRVTFVAGNAVRKAASDAKQQILEIAAEILEADVEDLEAKDRRVYVKGSPEKGMSFSDVVLASLSPGKKKPILGKGYYSLDSDLVHPHAKEANITKAYTFGGQCSEVQIDRETGQVKVLKVTATFDCGIAINPMAVEGQMEGGIYMGLGQALYEELFREKGQTFNTSFLYYKMPTSLDMPEVNSIIVEAPDPDGPFGAKSGTEGTQNTTASTIANAIYNAVGVRIKDLPITLEKVLEELEKS